MAPSRIEKEHVMTDMEIGEMILDIVGEIDYDIYKNSYLKETAEEPDLVDDNIATLVKIVRRHLPWSI